MPGHFESSQSAVTVSVSVNSVSVCVSDCVSDCVCGLSLFQGFDQTVEHAADLIKFIGKIIIFIRCYVFQVF